MAINRNTNINDSSEPTQDQIMGQLYCSVVENVRAQMTAKTAVIENQANQQMQAQNALYMIKGLKTLEENLPHYMGGIELSPPGTIEATYTTVQQPTNTTSTSSREVKLMLIIGILGGMLFGGIMFSLLNRAPGGDITQQSAYSEELDEARKAGESLRGQLNRK